VLIVAVTPFTRPAPPEALARFFKSEGTTPRFSATPAVATTGADGAATAHRISSDRRF